MKKRKQIKTKPEIKKAFAGALISTGLSFIGGMANNAKQRRIQEEAHKRNLAIAKATNMQEDQIRLEDFKAEGEGEVDYYAAKGGKMKTPSYNSVGGELKPLSSDMEIAKGKKHHEGGIDLLDKNGKPFIEIEGEETIKDGTKIYSDQTLAPNNKTYAENAKQLAKKKGKIEKNMDKGDSISRNTSKRKLALLDIEEEALFAHQEARKSQKDKAPVKAEEGANLAFGDTKFGKGVTAAIPYLDNITNAILTASAPEIKDPILQKVTPLKTKISTQAQLDDIDRAVDAAATNIRNTTANSATARAEITAARLKGAREKAAIRANKENIETSLYNANLQNAQNITARNLAKINQTQDKQFARSSDIQGRISANVADVADTFIEGKNRQAAEAFEKERLDIIRQYGTEGSTLRADLLNPTEVNKLKTDPAYAAEQRKRYLNNPKELARFDALFNTQRNLATPNFNN